MLTASPSGLFTRAAFRVQGVGDDNDRAFALWVHARAKGIAAQLDSLSGGPVATAEAAEKIEAAANLLWTDSEWGRQEAERLGAGRAAA